MTLLAASLDHGGIGVDAEAVDLTRTQEVEQHRELPPSAEVITSGKVTAVWDKG